MATRWECTWEFPLVRIGRVAGDGRRRLRWWAAGSRRGSDAVLCLVFGALCLVIKLCGPARASTWLTSHVPVRPFGPIATGAGTGATG